MQHSGSLLKSARKVALEFQFGDCRPDLMLFDEKGRPVAAIEVIVTHAPSEAAHEFYRQKRIVVVELVLTSDLELKDVEGKISRPDKVHLCPGRQRCPQCAHFQQPVTLRIAEAPCYNCRSIIEVPFIEGDDSRGSYIGPEGFTFEERELATKHGVLIEWQYSDTLRTKYWATTCGRCRKFVGSHYLFDKYVVPALEGIYRTKDIHLRDYCERCATPTFPRKKC